MLWFELTGIDSRRGITGFESQLGRGVARRALVGERGDGWA